ncbi:MAG: methylmalonyl-CoA epimerase [Candidatus Stahlbacteria bacterium]|nr:methylmalonyl-CoA epimerase [Candidatus Stahlbacteria bacterium]
MNMKVEHIGIAVKSIEEAIKVWCDILGFKLEGIVEVESQGVRVAVLEVFNGVKIELLESLTSDSSVARFLSKRGEGLHHICFEVKGIEKILLTLKSKGIKLIDKSPRAGALGNKVAFLHPSSTNGVLVEIAEAGSLKV